ncbi:hypothetical protein JCM10295v2_006825, partial [Rhodotorula toruloides]
MASSSANISDSVGPTEPSRSTTAVALSMQVDFDENWYTNPWSYSKAQADWVKAEGSLDHESSWEASSHLMYARIDSTPRGINVQNRSIITGSYDAKLESAHLISARKYTRTAMGKKGAMQRVDDFAGQTASDWLISAGVVPKYADINCDSN